MILLKSMYGVDFDMLLQLLWLKLK